MAERGSPGSIKAWLADNFRLATNLHLATELQLATNAQSATLVDDEIRLQRQRVLILILWGCGLSLALFATMTTLLAVTGRVHGIVPLLAWISLPLFWWAARLNQLGRVTAAAMIPVIGIFLANLVVDTLFGVGHVTYIGYAMAVLVAAILINTRAGIILAVLSFFAHLLSGYLQLSGGTLYAIEASRSIIPDALGLSLGILVLVIFNSIYGNEIQKALLREKNENKLLHARQSTLERHNQEGSQALDRRLIQIRTAAEISRSIGSLRDPDILLEQVSNLVRERFNLYYVGIFLVDNRQEYAVLRAGTGDAGKNMLSAGHRLVVGGDSMIGWATANHQPRIALDVGLEAVRFNNPYLPDTRSELALPILAGDQVLGAMSIQSIAAEAFDKDDITVLQSIADSLATALENLRLFAEAQANLDEINTLHRQYLERAWSDLPLASRDLSYTCDFEAGLELLQPPSTQIQVPLILRDQVIGNLTLETDDPALSPDDQTFLEAVTTQAALALENARLLEETRRRAEQEKVVTEISGKVWSVNDVDTILRTALKELAETLQASDGLIELEINPSYPALTLGREPASS